MLKTLQCIKYYMFCRLLRSFIIPKSYGFVYSSTVTSLIMFIWTCKFLTRTCIVRATSVISCWNRSTKFELIIVWGWFDRFICIHNVPSIFPQHIPILSLDNIGAGSVWFLVHNSALCCPWASIVNTNCVISFKTRKILYASVVVLGRILVCRHISCWNRSVYWE